MTTPATLQALADQAAAAAAELSSFLLVDPDRTQYLNIATYKVNK